MTDHKRRWSVPPAHSTFPLLRSRRGEYKLFPSREEVHSMRVFSLALVLCAISSAQDTTATIEGRVLDPSGRVITGAVVRATRSPYGRSVGRPLLVSAARPRQSGRTVRQ